LLERLPITVDDQTALRAWQETLHLARAYNLSLLFPFFMPLPARPVYGVGL
jgi:hypothetical protein